HLRGLLCHARAENKPVNLCYSLGIFGCVFRLWPWKGFLTRKNGGFSRKIGNNRRFWFYFQFAAVLSCTGISAGLPDACTAFLRPSAASTALLMIVPITPH